MAFNFNPKELSDFARYYGFHYDSLDPVSLVREVLIDMKRGLQGLSSSLPMIPSYITPVQRVPPYRTVLALDAGGTNLRAGLVHFNEKGKVAAEGVVKNPMPGTKGRVTAEEFFDQVAEAALPSLNAAPDIKGIGFTFSYPMEIQPDGDGILLTFSKEVDAPDVTGKLIGAGLREALARKGCCYNGPIVLLNDTTATLLAGVATIPADGAIQMPFGAPDLTKKAYEGVAGGPVVGFILGTGCNTAYPETSIPKIGFESKGAPQIVVCESGKFNLRYRGPLDREFDDNTKNPGTYTLEKATAGAYLGPLFQHVFKQAVKDKVICFNKSEEFLAMPTLETRNLNEFMRFPLSGEGPYGSLFAPNEKDALASTQYIASIITERGALFAATVLAATVKHMQVVCEPYSPIRIAVEGTTYMIYKGMRRSLEAQLHTLLTEEMPQPYFISPVEQASLIGAAVAALNR